MTACETERQLIYAGIQNAEVEGEQEEKEKEEKEGEEEKE